MTDETTAAQLDDFLACNGYTMTLMMVLNSFHLLDSMFRGIAYCLLLHQKNERKHLE